jgi:protocatechuate 4,5-dioxygenase, beta chain
MAKLVAGFCVSHDPFMSAKPEISQQKSADIVLAGMADVYRRLINAKVSTVIVVGDDHYCLFGPHCLPQYLIGIGDLDGPEEPWLQIDPYSFDNNIPLAEHIMNYGFDNGFDWGVAKSLTVDHSTMLPIHLSVRPRESGIKIIPVYTASGVSPLLRPRRAYQLGEMLGAAVEAWRGNERVAILGTGGISHWVGSGEMGTVNQVFDQMIIGHVADGDAEALINLSDEYVLKNGGNGAFEIRNWLVAMAAMGASGAELICYEAIPEWIAGCGIVELKGAA